MINSNTCRNRACNSLQKWSIGNTVRDILLADEAVSGYVGDNIYPLVASEGVVGDFIVYQRDKYIKRQTKFGNYEDECDLYVVAVSDNYDNAIAIAEAVDNALVGSHVLDSGGTTVNINLTDSTESYDDDKYLETLLFTIN